MARPASAPISLLGHHLRLQRGSRDQTEVALDIGIPRSTLAGVERGTHAPSLATALKLAKWLGWTVEQVVEAAGQPAPESGPEGGL
jgi:DNA-binding XRE family transcriptional regulator